MSAYVVMLREKTINPEEMEIYSKQAPLAREGHAIKPLVKYGLLKILEGAEFEGCLIHQFTTIKDAEDWYNSPKYQQAINHRHSGAVYRVFIVQGVGD